MTVKNEQTTSSIDDGLARIDDLDIAVLSDVELDSVAGGITDTTTAASCTCCLAASTVVRRPRHPSDS
jgi:hypothetical protein